MNNSDEPISALGPQAHELMRLSRLRHERQPQKAINFQRSIEHLPAIHPSHIDLDNNRITIGAREDITVSQYKQLYSVLTGLKPWRKGPFQLFGIDLDSEWNSALKWQRVVPHIMPIEGRRVLDVGCSNGYYLLRMVPQKPDVLMGIEPYWVYYYQWVLLNRFLPFPNLYCLPLRLEEMEVLKNAFDTAFCMGVLYHNRSPLEALKLIRRLLAPGGELILETLIIEGNTDTALHPQKRYANMRNIYEIPSVPRLENWLHTSGYRHIRCVDITRTTLSEQRKTAWIDSLSLESFLDPTDPTQTIEGHPAPVRAVMLATV
jgi:tRNA (mo5U34)-methyltransferase